MMFSVLALALFAQAALAAPLTRRAATAEEIARLAPDLGALPNTNPNQFGDCDGPRQLDGKIPRVPCPCPPLRDAYIQALTTNVLAGRAVNNTVVNVSFPTGDSLNDKHGRITAAIITLQNLNGPGKGCPGVSTTLGIQSRNLDTCGNFFCDGSQPSENTGAVPATESSGETTTATAAEPSPATSSDTAAPTEAPAQNDESGNGNENAGALSTVTVTSITVVTSTQTVTRGQETAIASPGGNGDNNEADNNVNNGDANNDNGEDNDNNNNNNGGDDNNDNNNNGVLTRDLVDQLAPELGSQPNNNPNQFGDCDGPQQPDGKIPRVPCQCPPTRDVFIDQLFANIQAGRAVKNPSVGVNFPTGNSKQDQQARIAASVITLQNLDGPGKGCPSVSTTFAAQSNAINAA